MKDSNQKTRRAQIEAAAYHVLADKGYKGASMLAIAKQAGASNQTLYRWYGTKQGLFSALVRKNSEGIANALTLALETASDPLQSLRIVGTDLLVMLTGERAINLNRAAAFDATHSGELGQAIADQGKSRIAPLITQIFANCVKTGALTGDPHLIADIYMRLLIGDVQIRRVINSISQLTPKQAENRATFALDTIKNLYS